MRRARPRARAGLSAFARGASNQGRGPTGCSGCWSRLTAMSPRLRFHATISSPRRGPWFGCSRSRPGHNRTAAFPELAALHDALAGHAVLHHNGSLPLREREEPLSELLPRRGPGCRVAEPLDTKVRDGLAVLGAHQLEGLVARRVASRWQPGRRSPHGRQHKLRRRRQLRVAASRPGDGPRPEARYVRHRDGSPAGQVTMGIASAPMPCRRARRPRHFERADGRRHVGSRRAFGAPLSCNVALRLVSPAACSKGSDALERGGEITCSRCGGLAVAPARARPGARVRARPRAPSAGSSAP